MWPWTSIDVPAFRRQPEIGRHIARAAEARGIIDRRDEGQHRHRADAGDGHETPRQLMAGDELHDESMQPAVLLPQRRARRQHRLHQLGRQLIVGRCLPHRLVEGVPADLAQADAEALEGMVDGVLDIQELALEVAPVRQKQARPVAALRPDVGVPEPAGTHDVRDTECIGCIGLVALRRHGRAHVLRLQADHRKPELQQLRMQPRRQ